MMKGDYNETIACDHHSLLDLRFEYVISSSTKIEWNLKEELTYNECNSRLPSFRMDGLL